MAFKSTMLFDCLKNILVTKSEEAAKKHIEDPNFKDASSFMMLRYLTMSRSEAVREAVLSKYDKLEKMPSDKLYVWLIRSVPRQNSSFISYIR
jgi:hypothetical protein